VTANVVFIEPGLSYSGGQPFAGVWIEWRKFQVLLAFSSEDIQKGFGKDASEIIQELTNTEQQTIDNVYFNVVWMEHGPSTARP
jgi:hypothetical protein